MVWCEKQMYGAMVSFTGVLRWGDTCKYECHLILLWSKMYFCKTQSYLTEKANNEVQVSSPQPLTG